MRPIPVDQDTPHNCTRAAVATLFGITLQDVPDLPQNETWGDVLNEWLSRFGFQIINIHYPHNNPEFVPRGYCLVSGPAARGFDHMVVYHNGELFHDPHSSRVGLKEEELIHLIVPLSYFGAAN